MANEKVSDSEVALIKGLIDHQNLNDQEVLSIFSHLSRNINSREIGWVRKGANQRYLNIAAATKSETEEFLDKYSQLEEVAERIGLYPVSDNHLSAYSALDYARSAVAIFNNNIIVARSQVFVILMVVAWTYLLHARFKQLGVNPVYVDADGQPKMIDGKPKHWELSTCISKQQAQLGEGEKNNLKFLSLLRNEIEHRSTEDINDDVQSKLQATALNFVRYARVHFGRKFDLSRDFGFAIQLQALKLKQINQLKTTRAPSKSVAAVNAMIESGMTSAQFNDPDYAFRVYVVPKVVNNDKKSDQAVTYSPVGSSVEMAIKQVERPKYRMKDVVMLLKEDGLPDVTTTQCIKAWQDNDLKNPGKGLAVELGGQWFWYPEGVDAIKAAVAT